MNYAKLLSEFLQVRENQKKSWNFNGQGRSVENIFVKVRENEKLVPPDVRFSVQNASNLISAAAPPQTPLGELTALPQTP